MTPDDVESQQEEEQQYSMSTTAEHAATDKDIVTFMRTGVTQVSPAQEAHRLVPEIASPTPSPRRLADKSSSGEQNKNLTQLETSGRSPGTRHEMQERLSEEYYHLLIGLCFGLVLLIYVLIHITVSVHDMMKRKRYRTSALDTRHLIHHHMPGFEEEDES